MHRHPLLSEQLVLEFSLGARLLNRTIAQAADLCASVHANPPGNLSVAPANLLCPSATDLGIAALLARCQSLLRTHALVVTQLPGNVTRLRVCAALDYLVSPSGVTVRAVAAKVLWPDEHDTGGCYVRASDDFDDVDLLNPLSRPAWLYYVASSPRGICRDSRPTDAALSPLWPNGQNIVQALPAICRRVFNLLQIDRRMHLLRLRLRHQLMTAMGPEWIDLALRSRLNPRRNFLVARHVNLVLRHEDAFRRMSWENPRLLTALTAWLHWTRQRMKAPLTDAIPAMRSSMLNRDLPPKAWRYFAAHGLKAFRLAPRDEPTWENAINTLRALQATNWPELPPPQFLGLLTDVVGPPEAFYFNTRDEAPPWVRLLDHKDSVPNWFWQWLCDAAHDSRADTRAYQDLCDEVVRLRWLVHQFKPEPDSNQRRARLRWLRAWADQKEKEICFDDQPGWAAWLQRAAWSDITRLHVVPLLSPRAVILESEVLHNCADDYVASCQSGNTLLISLRHPATGKHLALLELYKFDGALDWHVGQLAGPCNQRVPAWIRSAAPPIARITNACYLSSMQEKRSRSQARESHRRALTVNLELPLEPPGVLGVAAPAPRGLARLANDNYLDRSTTTILSG